MQDRKITTAEVAVIRAALACGSGSLLSDSANKEIEHLVVVDQCTCGCDSVDFTLHGQSAGSSLYVAVIGTTPKGGRVGVIVWGKDGHVTGLEVYDLGAGDGDLKLPIPESINNWENAS